MKDARGDEMEMIKQKKPLIYFLPAQGKRRRFYFSEIIKQEVRE